MTTSATSAERVAALVRDMILDGRLTSGSRLAETELARSLGVSRTPVREALGRLDAEGLVEQVPNRGARVASWSVAEIESVFELRSALEPRLTGAAALAAQEEDILVLSELAEQMLAVGLPGPDQDLDALVPLNRAFHDHLVRIADQPALAAALATALRTPLQRRNFSTYDEPTLRRSLAHHVEIVDALRARDSTWARAVMTSHIHNARSVMVRAATDQQEESR
ncbi:GntR family transcriptional regulator [Nocardioides mangrovicus]|uniref:GntR family transcriptional regulator n=1 Tax=Nocardioides mangrovicus TaxID=2478913 RepID=A0A3L8NYU3_9ACTN|nr:GntR family transcriptional regulator [Nocardioides mangrovicus]RLV48064.1 GntR family transcriptional regulator [Nocardioides mangrovicus]